MALGDPESAMLAALSPDPIMSRLELAGAAAISSLAEVKD
jgi:hypothetical protein